MEHCPSPWLRKAQLVIGSRQRGHIGQALGLEKTQLAVSMLIGSWRHGSIGEEVEDPVFQSPLPVETEAMYNQNKQVVCKTF